MMRSFTRMVTLSSIIFPATVSAQERTWEWHGGMYPMWWMWSAWGLGMMLMMLVFWGLVVVGLIVGIRWLMRGQRPFPADRALDILRERYARGEIGKEEFEAKLKDLGGKS
jgi:putative membrane protein